MTLNYHYISFRESLQTFENAQDRNMEFAFHLLPYILQVPPRNKDRPSTAEVAAHFIQIFPNTTPMETKIDANRHTSFMHPLVITLGARGNLIQSVIFIEDNVIPIRNGMLSAVDRLLKLYFVIDIEYAPECRHVLHFLQRVVIGINDDLPLSRGGSDLSLFVNEKLRSG
nr:uncharacterized protein LOC124812121 isoform X2 [Hydra vulgaris]